MSASLTGWVKEKYVRFSIIQFLREGVRADPSSQRQLLVARRLWKTHSTQDDPWKPKLRWIRNCDGHSHMNRCWRAQQEWKRTERALGITRRTLTPREFGIRASSSNKNYERHRQVGHARVTRSPMSQNANIEFLERSCRSAKQCGACKSDVSESIKIGPSTKSSGVLRERYRCARE